MIYRKGNTEAGNSEGGNKKELKEIQKKIFQEIF